MTRKGFLSMALLPFLFKKKVKNPYTAQMAGAALASLSAAANAAKQRIVFDQNFRVEGTDLAAITRRQKPLKGSDLREYLKTK